MYLIAASTAYTVVKDDEKGIAKKTREKTILSARCCLCCKGTQKTITRSHTATITKSAARRRRSALNKLAFPITGCINSNQYSLTDHNHTTWLWLGCIISSTAPSIRFASSQNRSGSDDTSIFMSEDIGLYRNPRWRGNVTPHHSVR